jgi:hypothetical protein
LAVPGQNSTDKNVTKAVEIGVVVEVLVEVKIGSVILVKFVTNSVVTIKLGSVVVVVVDVDFVVGVGAIEVDFNSLVEKLSLVVGILDVVDVCC